MFILLTAEGSILGVLGIGNRAMIDFSCAFPGYWGIDRNDNLVLTLNMGIIKHLVRIDTGFAPADQRAGGGGDCNGILTL
jgi:hypothetical protein